MKIIKDKSKVKILKFSLILLVIVLKKIVK